MPWLQEVHDAWTRLKKLEQLQQLEALHSDPKELRVKILRELKAAPSSASAAFGLIASRAQRT